MATRAVIRTTGGPEVIEWETVDLPPPGPGEVRMRNTAIGLNYIDTYHRSGLYPLAMPSGLGSEAAGVVEAVGEGVEGFAPGDHVATFGPPIGAYATERNIPARSLFRLPEGISDEVAAAVLLKGATTEFLVERCATLRAGDTALVHAAAGGVGQLLVQWLNHIGVTVIATVGSEEKAARVRELGAGHVLIYGDDADIAKEVREITDGIGCAAVFDGVGKATWESSLGSTRRRGLIISFGNASGPVDGVHLGVLARGGSLYVTRPTMFDYYVTPEERAAGATRLFDLVGSGVLGVDIGQRFPLADAAEAHRRLEARQTIGSTLLIP